MASSYESDMTPETLAKVAACQQLWTEDERRRARLFLAKNFPGMLADKPVTYLASLYAASRLHPEVQAEIGEKLEYEGWADWVKVEVVLHSEQTS